MGNRKMNVTDRFEHLEAIASKSTAIILDLMKFNEIPLDEAIDMLHRSEFYMELTDTSTYAWNDVTILAYREICIDNGLVPATEQVSVNCPDALPLEFAVRIFEKTRTALQAPPLSLHSYFRNNNLFRILMDTQRNTGCDESATDMMCMKIITEMSGTPEGRKIIRESKQNLKQS